MPHPDVVPGFEPYHVATLVDLFTAVENRTPPPSRPDGTGVGGSSRARSVGAVAAGFIFTAVFSVATDVAMHAAGVFPPWGEPMSNRLFAWATVYRIVYTVVGGYVAARLAPRRPMAHVMVLGACGTLVAAFGAAATWNEGPAFGPKWYPILLVVTALPSVWAGGVLRVRQTRAT